MAGERILVVEDNETNMKLVRDVLQAKGYSTLEATTGEDAVELARTLDPALVLMDVQLPGIDGVEALAQLRGDERTSAIPVVALTAQAMRGDSERFLDVGFDGYLSKPVDVVELIRVVESTAIVSDRPAKILVVDDVPENVRLLEAVLVPRGYEVVTATDGRAALDLVEAEEPDLILLDVDDARPRRLRRVQPAACERRHRGAPGDHGHVERRPGEEEGDRSRRRRLHPETVQPRRAAHARAVAAPDQALPRHDQGAGCGARRAQPHTGVARADPGRRARAAATAASLPLPAARRCRRLLRKTRRSCTATAGRSRCSSPTCAAGQALSTPSSPRS